MLYKRFEVKGLAHYSYLIACPGTGEAIVVDPRRDIDVYLKYAEEEGLQIRWILETHIHADYASGARELAEVTGAQMRLSAYDEGELYDVSFKHNPIKDGESVQVGGVRVEALHTPGHTPEHLSFLVYDTVRSAEIPLLMLSGDFLFVGSVGRPDLLGEEAKMDLARQLYRSVRHKLATLPDGLEIHPAHGAGSMCGAGLSARPVSTLGYERATNPYLDPSLSEDEFVTRVLSTVPPFPPYYRLMKELNARGAPSVLNTLQPQPLSLGTVKEEIEAGATILDVRPSRTYAAGHIPKSLWAGEGSGLPVWGSWTVPYDRPIILVTTSPQQAEAARRWLLRVGLDQVLGYLGGGFDSWRNASLDVAITRELSSEEAHRELDAGCPLTIVDVRGDAEWQSGHIPGATHIMGGYLASRLAELPEGPLATICAGGYRSCVAASVLEHGGRSNLAHIVDGFSGWRRDGFPVHRGA